MASPERPAFGLLAAEALAIPQLLLTPLQRAVPIPHGRGQPVAVYPGYLVSDIASLRLRRSLQAANYPAYGWGLGQNRGVRANTLDRLVPQLERMCDNHGQPVTLIGWSLGGIFAREVAKLRPDLVRLVITLGSPFSGDPRANNAWRIYELLNDHPVDRPPIDVNLPEKPPVRTIAVYSQADGVVSVGSARGNPGESDRQVEVGERHLEMVRAQGAIAAIGRLLAEELGQG